MTGTPSNRLAISAREAGERHWLLCWPRALRWCSCGHGERNRPSDCRRSGRTNCIFPGFGFPDNVRVGADLAEALQGADIVVLVTPSTHIRELAFQMLPHTGTRRSLSAPRKGSRRNLPSHVSGDRGSSQRSLCGKGGGPVGSDVRSRGGGR